MAAFARLGTRRAFAVCAIASSIAVFAAGGTAGAGVKSPILESRAAPFSADTVIAEARSRARQPYQPPANTLPEPFASWGYSEYGQARFKPEKTLFARDGSKLGVQVLHRGYIYRDRIEVSIVEDGVARPLRYDPDLFESPEEEEGEGEPDISRVAYTPPPADFGFAGVRIVRNDRDGPKEFAVFQGASYFRAIGEGDNFGLSARGIAIRTGSPEGEEFPIFRHFWVEKPAHDADTVVIHALLDGPSVTGAYRFEVRPGASTAMRVEAVLFPRRLLEDVGIAVGTSMFHFDGNSHRGVDDYRPSVHDSDGLLIRNGRGEQVWRPLANPAYLQISDFVDQGPKGFGLLQRKRGFENYQDMWAHYEARPNLWVVPESDWGPGAVRLVEIPTENEYFDNIVAFWRPQDPLRPGQEYRYAYRLEWGDDARDRDVAIVSGTRQGRIQAAPPSAIRQFLIDFDVPDGAAVSEEEPEAVVTANLGVARHALLLRRPGGWRLMFQLDPKEHRSIELRADVTGISKETEVWLYRWTR